MCKEFFIAYLGHNIDAGANVAECFWKVHHADGDQDDGADYEGEVVRSKDIQLE